MFNSLRFKEYLPFAILVVISLFCRIIIATYGLPYMVHVDESQVLKDPLKILLTYKNLDFHIPTNLYNYILACWHFIIYCGGFAAGKWHSMLEYQNIVARDSYNILFCFRLLNVAFSTVADIIFLHFIIKKVNQPYIIKLSLALIIIFNPFIYNSTGFVKFDAICYLFYSILIYWGYLYFVENKVEYRKKLYLVAFLALSTRIEEISFLAGFLFYDFYIIYKHNLKVFLKSGLPAALLPGFILYLIITLTPLVMVYNYLYAPKVIYTTTKTFDYAIATRMGFSYISGYKYYIISSFMILSPVVILVFLFKMLRHNLSIKFLILPLLITNFVLALFFVKNVHYFLMSSVIILFIFVKYIEENKNQKLSILIIIFSLFYFISYDSELLYFTLKHNANDIARKVVLKNSTAKDTIVIDGICDLRIPQSPKILREQISALKEVGGSTGYGLAQRLITSTQDSIDSRFFLTRVGDYFWGKTKYEGKWLIGYDTSTIKKINPKLIIIFSHMDTLPNTYGSILKNDYTIVAENTYHFLDPRMNYKNYYFFHSFFIFKRNQPTLL